MHSGFSTTVFLAILFISGCDDSSIRPSPAPAAPSPTSVAPPIVAAPSPKDLAKGDAVSDTAVHFDLGTAQRLGIKVQDNLDPPGMRIVAVEENSNAKKAGLELNDIVTRMNDEPVHNADDFKKKYEPMLRDVSFGIQYLRNGVVYDSNVITP
jgi:S1-C subfamily serine protease